MKGHGVCKYTPTCSEYALQAYEKYGFFHAFDKRILKGKGIDKCHQSAF